MKKVIVLLMSVLSVTAFTQVTDGESALQSENKDTTDGWKKGMVLTFTGSNVGLINWAAGGQNTVSFNALFNGYANYKKGPLSWDNTLDIGYGAFINGRTNWFNKEDNGQWIKSDDRIELSSKLGRRLSDQLYAAGLLNFRTQMAPGFNYPDITTRISAPFAPAYLLLAAGADYKPNSDFSLFFAPATAKMTFVADTALSNAGAFGVESGKMFRGEFGGYLRAQYKRKLTDNIGFGTKLDLFSNYLNNPQNIDVNWETLIDVKLWKFLTLTFSTQLIYDDDIDITVFDDAGNVEAVGPRVQFKHVLGVGLSWKFDK